MAHNRILTAASFSLAAALAIPAAAPAAAEDFTFRVPLEISSFAPGTTFVHLIVRCLVSRALTREGFPSPTRDNLVAERYVHPTFGAGPVNTSEVITVAMNATNPRTRPASEGRYYACSISEVRLTFPEGDTLNIFASRLAADYETATGHRLTTVVTFVHGEIPR